MSRTRSARLCALLLATSLATACGSTVQLESEVAVGGEQGLGGAVPGLAGDGLTVVGSDPSVDPGAAAGQPGAGPAAPGAAPLPGSSAAGPTGTGGGTPGAAPTTAGGPATSSGAPVAAAVPAKGRGWDEDFVYVGVTTQKDVQAVASGVGARGLDAGDQEAQALAVAAEINRTGGMLGRKIKLVFRDQGTVETANDPNTAGNAACTFFAQDRPVIALLNPVTLMDVPSFRACLAKARIPLFSASVAAVDKKVGAALAPYFYQSVAPTWDALAPVLVSRLKAQGWFGGWDPRAGRAASGAAKIGVLVPADDVGKRVAAIVTSALRAAGAGAPVVFEMPAGGDSSAAVLQFSGNGVTHVIVTDSGLLPFQISASSQGYRPRYGIHTYNAPQAFLETNSPAGQNTGALGVGWSPSFDVSDANDKADTGPGEKTCKAIMAKGGQTFSGKRLAEAVAFAFCDGIRLIAAGAVAGGGFSGQQVFEGVQRIAPRFQPAFAFGNGLGRDSLFLPGAARDLAWVEACSCTRYAGGGPTAFPK